MLFLLSELQSVKVESILLRETDGCFFAFSDDEDISDSCGKADSSAVLNVDDIETSIV